jgi:hypothetical protein
MNTERLNELKAKVEAMTTDTTAQRARKAKALQHLANAEKDNGAYGKVVEILSKSHGSHARNYAKQGKADAFIKVENGGKVSRYAVEVKTNGGRIGALLNGKAPRFVVYSLDLCNSTTKGKRRVITPKLIPTTLFLDKLREFNAIKQTNGANDEPAIQSSSKKLFDWLSGYEVDFDSEKTYTLDEIEG